MASTSCGVCRVGRVNILDTNPSFECGICDSYFFLCEKCKIFGVEIKKCIKGCEPPTSNVIPSDYVVKKTYSTGDILRNTTRGKSFCNTRRPPPALF